MRNSKNIVFYYNLTVNISIDDLLPPTGDAFGGHKTAAGLNTIEEERLGHKGLATAPETRLHYHSLIVWLALSYGIASLFSWTVICILCYKPLISSASYYDKTGTRTRKEFGNNDWWTKVARVTSNLVALATIPVTSAICAKAAVVYCQIAPGAKRSTLTLRQTLALSDKGWSNIGVLGGLLVPGSGWRIRSPFLVWSALLCGLGWESSSPSSLAKA